MNHGEVVRETFDRFTSQKRESNFQYLARVFWGHFSELNSISVRLRLNSSRPWKGHLFGAFSRFVLVILTETNVVVSLRIHCASLTRKALRLVRFSVREIPHFLILVWRWSSAGQFRAKIQSSTSPQVPSMWFPSIHNVSEYTGPILMSSQRFNCLLLSPGMSSTTRMIFDQD